jgi:hypothetical protein
MANDADGFKNWFDVSYNDQTNEKCGELSYSLETKDDDGVYRTLESTEKVEIVNNKYL